MEVFRFLALGDSYTCGEGVEEDNSWPHLLVNHLKKHQRWEKPEIVATTGWTTDELWDGIKQYELAPYYNWVFLLIGVNNQYRGYSIDQFKREFEGLLQFAIHKTADQSRRVGLISIPDYGVTPFGRKKASMNISFELNHYNSIIKEMSIKYWTRWIDITPVSQMAQSQPLLLAGDALHPSGLMYEMWVDKILHVCFSDLDA